MQRVGAYLALDKVAIPPHKHREPPQVRFNWLLDTLPQGCIYTMLISEASMVDHVVLLTVAVGIVRSTILRIDIPS